MISRLIQALKPNLVTALNSAEMKAVQATDGATTVNVYTSHSQTNVLPYVLLQQVKSGGGNAMPCLNGVTIVTETLQATCVADGRTDDEAVERSEQLRMTVENELQRLKAQAITSQINRSGVGSAATEASESVSSWIFDYMPNDPPTGPGTDTNNPVWQATSYSKLNVTVVRKRLGSM